MEIRTDLATNGKILKHSLGYIAGQVEVTSACFQACPKCSSGIAHRDGTFNHALKLHEVEELTNELAEFSAFEHLTFTGGDPQAWGPLKDYLKWFKNYQPFKLQFSTAMMKDLDEEESDLWREAVTDLRISMDALDANLYRMMRGTKQMPLDIFKRLLQLQHPNLAFIVTVFPENIDNIESLLDSLNHFHLSKDLPIRKVIVLAGLGEHGVPGDDFNFWQKWDRLSEEGDWDVPTSFSDNIRTTKGFLDVPEKCREVQCWAGKAGFHIKANGDVYPCCLVGGEAIETREEFRLGNIKGESIQAIYKSYIPQLYYLTRPDVCRNICQYKQLQLNLIGHAAQDTTLSMP